METENSKLVGIVKWFGGTTRDGRKLSYGFIRDENENDVYIHQNEIKNIDTINEGDLVYFTLVKRQKKYGEMKKNYRL